MIIYKNKLIIIQLQINFSHPNLTIRQVNLVILFAGTMAIFQFHPQAKGPKGTVKVARKGRLKLL